MASFKSSPVFFSLLTILGIAAVGSGWCIYDRSQAAQKSHKTLLAKRNELNTLLSATPGPSKDNDIAVKADVDRSEVALNKMRAELKGHGKAAEALQAAVEAYASVKTLSPTDYTETLRAAKIPSEPTHLFFNITTFVEALREAAQTAEIKIKPDERFGFNTYANSGPDLELIPQVFRQRQVAEYILRAFVDAHPAELISFQREQPLTEAQRSLPASAPVAVQRGASTTTTSDFFVIDPRISARVPGFVNASAFRLMFNGDSEALRSLLNKLATFELPLVVRSVEVQPIGKNNLTRNSVQERLARFKTAEAPAEGDAPEKPKPLVEKALSTFTVTVELIDLVATPQPAATPNL